LIKISLDANCFIYAIKIDSQFHKAIKELLKAGEGGAIEIWVSQHSIDELKKKPDEALNLACTFQTLRHYPIGCWDQQIPNWNTVSGNWGEAKRKESIQKEIHKFAKSGASLRDRGAYLDALVAGLDYFVTNDNGLVGSGPAGRLKKKFNLSVLCPEEMVTKLN